jgi:ubiquitin carboxyl-terminal hydrolase 14
MVTVTIKWNKNTYTDVVVNPIDGVKAFKDTVFSLTNVPHDRQKLMAKGAWTGILKDDVDLSTVKLNDGVVVTLMGTADVIVAKPIEVKFVEDMSAEEQTKAGVASPAGLINLGNTCYLNSTVQCLRYLPAIREILSKSANERNLLSQLNTLFLELDRSSTSVVPFMFVQMFRMHFPQFAEQKQGRYMQQDAEEFLSSFISHLMQQATNASEVMNSLGMQVEEQLTCLESTEEPVITRQELNFKLVCNIQGGVGGGPNVATSTASSSSASTITTTPPTTTTSIDHLIDGIKLSLETVIEKQSLLLQRNALWKKQQRLQTLPQHLFIQFMRFFWKATPDSMEHPEGGKCKILRAVSFPEVIIIIIIIIIFYETDNLTNMMIFL